MTKFDQNWTKIVDFSLRAYFEASPVLYAPVFTTYEILLGEMGRYQLTLYLLMCIPATLPAAFLAFNQVFLSATPDHWCNVTELYNSNFNLSLHQIKDLSIPRRDMGRRSDIKVYEKCQQYDVNFTEYYYTHDSQFPSEPDPTWKKVHCKEGWHYDRSEYDDTLVTEVSLCFAVLGPKSN